MVYSLAQRWLQHPRNVLQERHAGSGSLSVASSGPFCGVMHLSSMTPRFACEISQKRLITRWVPGFGCGLSRLSLLCGKGILPRLASGFEVASTLKRKRRRARSLIIFFLQAQCHKRALCHFINMHRHQSWHPFRSSKI